jgi:hypothetical protein
MSFSGTSNCNEKKMFDIDPHILVDVSDHRSIRDRSVEHPHLLRYFHSVRVAYQFIALKLFNHFLSILSALSVFRGLKN